MSEEVLKANGRLDLFEIAKRKDGTPITGKKADGTPYTNYKYKIGGKYFSGFKKLSEFDTPVELGDYVIVAYKEAPNQKNKDKPYKNIINITKAKEPTDEVTPEEMKEENKKVNMQHVGEPTTPDSEEERWDKINAVKDQKILFGMVFKKTCDGIFAHSDLTIDKHFNSIFAKLHKKALEIREKYLEK